MVKSSDIDDLFAQAPVKTSSAKKQLKPAAVEPSVTTVTKKRKSDAPVKPTSTSKSASKRQVMVVEDTSSAPKLTVATTNPSKKRKSVPTVVNVPKDVAEFTDSRGTTRKKTDDGLAIYSEAELKLNQGGDTALCPFDCDCCF